MVLLCGDTGSSRLGSSFLGEFTRVEIGHKRIT